MENINDKIKVTIDEKIAKARDLKIKGNDYFKENNFKRAIHQYHSALMYLRGVDCDIQPSVPFGKKYKLCEEDEKVINILHADLQNNLAACFLKQDPIRYDRILECCEEAITRQPRNLKATYRKALSFYHLHLYEKGKDSIKNADEIACGKDSAVKNLANLIDSKLKEQDKECLNLYKNSLLINSFN